MNDSNRRKVAKDIDTFETQLTDWTVKHENQHDRSMDELQNLLMKLQKMKQHIERNPKR